MISTSAVVYIYSFWKRRDSRLMKFSFFKFFFHFFGDLIGTRIEDLSGLILWRGIRFFGAVGEMKPDDF